MQEPSSLHTGHSGQYLAALNSMIDGMTTISTALHAMRDALKGGQVPDEPDADPKNPRNKQTIGGFEKFTPRGVEVCYRLFDRGLSRYAVAQAMGISFGAATHRYDAWLKVGGLNRTKQDLN